MSMTVNSMAKNQVFHKQLSSGLRINSAADDAAGLAISQRMEAQVRGLDQGTRNTADMQSLVRTAEGAMSTIGDSLQRINQLSIQASNGTLTDADRGIIQREVSQLLNHIDQTASQAQFNTKNLLDGTATNLNTASSPNGTGPQVSIPEMSLKALGLENFDVTANNFDISSIQNALNQVNSARASLGATENRMNHIMTSNDITSLNMAASKSRIADADMALAAMNNNREKLLQDYRIMSLNRQKEQEKNKLSVFLG